MEFIDASILAYKKACVRFINEYARFNNENRKKTGEYSILATPKDGDEIFISLCEVFSWTTKLYDRMDKNNLDSNEKGFMSGVKFVDNTLKHEKTGFQISDFIKTAIMHTIEKRKKNISCGMRFVFTFTDIPHIPMNPNWKSQRDNYLSFLNEKDVTDVLIEAEKILKKYYDLGSDID